jgi:hypothetical protein
VVRSARGPLRLAGIFMALGLAACSPAGPDSDLLIEPIQIESVEVLILESSPPQASSHVRGILGDGCSGLHSVGQQRSGNIVTVTILRERPRHAICIQIAKLYDDVIRLEGSFPPGVYQLRVNAFETTFTTQ